MTALAKGQQHHRGNIRRFDAIFGGPIWWAFHLGGSYWLIPRACVWGSLWPLHVWTIAMLLLIGRALLSGFQILRAGQVAGDVPGASRDVFIGWLGIFFSLFFGAVTIAEWVPALTIDPCA